MRNKGSKRGFTLVEVAISIVIVMLISIGTISVTVSTNSMSERASERLRAVSRVEAALTCFNSAETKSQFERGLNFWLNDLKQDEYRIGTPTTTVDGKNYYKYELSLTGEHKYTVYFDANGEVIELAEGATNPEEQYKERLVMTITANGTDVTFNAQAFTKKEGDNSVYGLDEPYRKGGTFDVNH